MRFLNFALAVLCNFPVVNAEPRAEPRQVNGSMHPEPFHIEFLEVADAGVHVVGDFEGVEHHTVVEPNGYRLRLELVKDLWLLLKEILVESGSLLDQRCGFNVFDHLFIE